jgi:hypothetical protein
VTASRRTGSFDVTATPRGVRFEVPAEPPGRQDPHHDVQRMIRLERRPRLVPLPGAWALRLPSRAAPLATPPEQLLLDVPLARSLRLRRHAQIHYHDRIGCQSIGQI